MRIIHCDPTWAGQILDIFNDAILTSTALYDYKPRTPEMMSVWFEVKQRGNYPVLGMICGSGELMGFASYGTFRGWPAYKYTVEHSVYVSRNFRGQGIGKKLLQAIITEAQKQDYHLLVGVIDSQNTISIDLHRKMGFTHAGTLRQAGYKFGRWLDVDVYQLVLPTPACPKEE